MIPRSVRSPSIPIPFNKMLKIVALVERNDPQTKQLLEQLAFQNYEVEVCDGFERDLEESADVDLGDLLIHEGPAAESQKHAAQVFGADRTYFVLNGTSTSNKIVTNSVLKRGDLVLFDRNNHKSMHQGALVQAGAIPVFLPTARKIMFHTYVVRQ